MAQPIRGLVWDDVQRMRGDYDLGVNSTGVINSSLHIGTDEIVVKETMPAHHVEDIMASVHAFRDKVKQRRPGGHLVGQIPLPIYYEWQKQWQSGPQLHGVLWRTFLTGKLMDGDFEKFRITKV